MRPAKKVGNDRADAIRGILKKHLGKRAKGRQIIAAFEEDPENSGEILVNYIREQLPKEKYDALVEEIAEVVGEGTSQTQINNLITGGKIDQLINIGSLDHLTIEKKISPFRDVKQLLVFLSIFLLVAGGIYAAIWYARQPRKLSGDFNIAIAQFGEITDKGIKATALSTTIGNSLLNFLDTEFKSSNLDFAVDVSNQNMPLVTEDAGAEKLAKQVGATIVIYGNVYVQGGEAKLSPRFYVSQDFDASELTGESELAKPILFNMATLNQQEKVEQDLKTKSAILVNVTYSLIYLSDQNLEDAFVFIQKAINSAKTLTDPFAGREYLYVVASYIETKRKHYDVSSQLLDEAVEISPNYARAHLGRGNIYYRQATQSDPYDETLLEKALTEYQSAYQAQDQPQGANLPVKAHMSIGNVYFAKAENSNDDPEYYREAIKNFRFVTDQYERSKAPPIREIAAVSYFVMGLAYERIGNVQEAIQALENALETTLDPTFKATVENQLNVTRKLIDSP
jgi:tetratricopeptide (TPR) repeat protein